MGLLFCRDSEGSSSRKDSYYGHVVNHTERESFSDPVLYDSTSVKRPEPMPLWRERGGECLPGAGGGEGAWWAADRPWSRWGLPRSF